MTDKPIIFSGPMVRALIEGRKTQTRRVLKPQPGDAARGCYHRPDGRWIWVSAPRPDNGPGFYGVGVTDPFRLPYAPGDRLWVREAFWPRCECGYLNFVEGCNAPRNCAACDAYLPGPKGSPIHMPRWASRLTLTVTDVRVQRLQEISDGDACAEGCPGWYAPCHPDHGVTDGRMPWEEFRDLWNSLHGPDAWDANPWVCALTFTVERRNIDAGSA